jgi:hypothetical protein
LYHIAWRFRVAPNPLRSARDLQGPFGKVPKRLLRSTGFSRQLTELREWLPLNQNIRFGWRR